MSHDKTRVIHSVGELGVKTISSELALIGDEGGDEVDRWAQIHEVYLTDHDRQDIEAFLKRITREQPNPRPEAAPLHGAMTALLAREHHGIGQEVNASHLGSISYPLKPTRSLLVFSPAKPSLDPKGIV